MRLSPGTRLGEYEILECIGSGGIGEVYRARDAQLHRDVALKILPEEFATDPERMRRLQQEARILASLNHHNIAVIYGVQAGAAVMELVDGPTLQDQIAGGPLTVPQALPVFAQIIDALEYAHEHGVV